MLPRTLWIIILKIFGLYLFLQALYSFTQLFPYFLMASSQYGSSIILELTILTFTISVYLLMAASFLFKTDWLIVNLKLDKNIQEDKLEINIHRSTVLTIVIILAGITIFVDSLPMFLKEIYNYYQFQNVNHLSGFKDYPRAGYLITQLVKLFISIIMVGYSRLIVNVIERKRKGKITPAKE